MNDKQFVKLHKTTLHRRDLTATAKILYSVLEDFDSGKYRLGTRRLAKECGTTQQAILRAIAELEQHQLIQVERTGDGKRNRYRLAESANETLAVDNDKSDNETLAGCLRNVSGSDNETLAHSDRLYNQTKRARNSKTVVQMPKELNTQEFIAAWNNWQSYHREIKKPLTPTTARAQLIKLAKAGPDIATAMIRQSIEQGWQGLFPIKGDNTPRKLQPGETGPDGLAVCGEVSEALARKVLGWQER